VDGHDHHNPRASSSVWPAVGLMGAGGGYTGR
jgi:hypothetical protein